MAMMAMLMIASRVLALAKSKAIRFMPSQEPKRTTCFKRQAFTKAETRNALQSPALHKSRNAQHASQIWTSQELKRASRFKIKALTRADTHDMLQKPGPHKS